MGSTPKCGDCSSKRPPPSHCGHPIRFEGSERDACRELSDRRWGSRQRRIGTIAKSRSIRLPRVPVRSTVLLIIAVLAAVATLLASAPGEASLSAESEAIVAVNARELQATDEALRRSILEARLDLATDLAEVEAKALSRHVALEQIARAVDGHWPSDFALHALVEEVERAYRLDTAELALLGDRLRAAQGAGGGTEELRELDRVVGLTARRTSDSPAIALIEALDDRLTITFDYDGRIGNWKRTSMSEHSRSTSRLRRLSNKRCCSRRCSIISMTGSS
jgi:hypothetical protein